MFEHLQQMIWFIAGALQLCNFYGNASNTQAGRFLKLLQYLESFSLEKISNTTSFSVVIPIQPPVAPSTLKSLTGPLCSPSVDQPLQ
jgi:hypothetical protein